MTAPSQSMPAGVFDGGVSPGAASHEPLPYGPDDFRREIKRVKRKRRIIAVICVLAALVVAAVIVAVAVLKVPSSLVTVDSDAMQPVLERGQVAYVQQVDSPADDDVVVYRDTDGTTQFKRVIAKDGEWVNITSDGKALVSTVTMEGASAEGIDDGDAAIVASRQVPDNSCFVIADSETSALEALYQSENYIANNQIVGKITYRAWPIGSIGPVS